jgi:hypothetical protein
MRISLFESAEAMLLRIFDALLSEIAPKIDSLDVNMLDLSGNERIVYKGILG